MKLPCKKEPFYKRQKNRSTKGKRTVLQKAKDSFYKIKKGTIKKKPLYKNKLPKYKRKY
jgi:hypothetical protein